MSKQRLARRIRKGARYAMERHQRNVRQVPLELTDERPARRWPYLLAFLALLAVMLYTRCGHAAERPPSPLGAAQLGCDLAFGLVLAVLVCGAAFCLVQLGEAFTWLLTCLFRKDR